MGADVQFESEVDLRAHSNSTTRGNSNTEGMIRIPGSTFRMGSDKHYPEEAPVHRVTVGDFWIDTHPVTNRQFKEFVNATHHVTFPEIPPDPKDYPGGFPHMLFRWCSHRRATALICATGVSGGLS
jgi:formylglycine-generating enzyme required for sulfatase activity